MYSIGRLPTCDVEITLKEVKRGVLETISKLHCKILIERMEDTAVVYLEDYSFNGTFVNGNKVGKGRRVILQSNDQISLASPAFRVYVFMAASSFDSWDYPEAIRSRYIISRKLGAGGYGEVYLVFQKETTLQSGCKRYAMKVVTKNKLTKRGKNMLDDSKRVMNEVNILRSLRHPCIISICDIVDTPDKLYMFLELMEGGELFTRITSREQLPEAEAKLIFYQIVLAVRYLHSQNVIHRDLKPENILLGSDNVDTIAKVTDFGLSRFVASDMKTFCGTVLYIAPEILETQGRGSYTKQVDVWSLGVILYACLSGLLPFGKKKESLRDDIRRGKYTFPESQWKGVSSDAIDLIKKMLTVNPLFRITVDNILNHPWLQDEDMRAKVENIMRLSSDDNWPDENTEPAPEASFPSAKRRRLE